MLARVIRVEADVKRSMATPKTVEEALVTSYAIPRASPNSPTAKTTPVGGLILRPCHQLRQLGDVGGDAPTRIKEAANTAASTD